MRMAATWPNSCFTTQRFPLATASYDFVPMLSLLGNYLFGYQVTWPGLAVGMLEVGVGGFALGWTAAWLINRLVGAFERDLERRLAMLTTLEGMDGQP